MDGEHKQSVDGVWKMFHTSYGIDRQNKTEASEPESKSSKFFFGYYISSHTWSGTCGVWW